MVEQPVSAEAAPADELLVDASLGLPESTRAAAQARGFVTSFCESAKFSEEICQTAALLTSELVTNAVLHGKSSATLHLHAPPPCLRVTVEDHNPDLPAVGESPELSATSGRGLHIVSVLATRWGVERTNTGKAIWFELE